ncbi:hypothetical protein ANN_18125 [Periplaneta americana]|uniref:Craniofacial development protein 2-like n=1 Tax=Periplaneta americana TaxID=6978 RepID=A0ABQ8SMV5_PERAM|nr:hypothetical protein ANN_18125 [Periplaneta americana]
MAGLCEGGNEPSGSLKAICKSENLKEEMRRNKVEDVMRISEVWWENSGELVMQVYMPHSELADEEVEENYDKIEEIVEKQKKAACVIIMGNWNAAVGEQDGRTVGKYGLEKRNDREEYLMEFCIQTTAEETIGFTEGVRIKKPWVTGKMLEKMEERRKWKNINTEEDIHTLRDSLDVGLARRMATAETDTTRNPQYNGQLPSPVDGRLDGQRERYLRATAVDHNIFKG